MSLQAVGGENALTFSQATAPAQATFSGLTLGSSLTGASLVVNSNLVAR